MAGVSDDQITSVCGHCERAIPYSNIDLHFAHCSRNLEKCEVCGDMIPRKHADEHFQSNHAPVSCSLCGEAMDRRILDVHREENCPQRILACEYCEIPLPATDLLEHQEVCGNRTEKCHRCHRYVRLRERHGHESTCSGVVHNIAESSSSRNTRPAERDPAGPRRQPRELSRRHVLFTIAVTGIAVVLGSLFFQRKPDPAPAN